jgi:hypothetical protein
MGYYDHNDIEFDEWYEEMESEFRVLFSRAKRYETLKLMTYRQVREFGLRLPESDYGFEWDLRVSAKACSKVCYRRAAALFNAAYERLCKIENITGD